MSTGYLAIKVLDVRVGDVLAGYVSTDGAQMMYGDADRFTVTTIVKGQRVALLTTDHRAWPGRSIELPLTLTVYVARTGNLNQRLADSIAAEQRRLASVRSDSAIQSDHVAEAKQAIADIALDHMWAADVDDDTAAISVEAAIDAAIGIVLRAVHGDRDGIVELVAEGYGVKL